LPFNYKSFITSHSIQTAKLLSQSVVNIEIGNIENTSLAFSNEDHDLLEKFFLLGPTIIVKTSRCC